MFMKSVIAAAAIFSLAGGALAATVDWGVHNSPSETAAPIVSGSFTDYYLFSIPAGFNLLASVTVANNLTLPGPVSIFQINNGKYSLWSDAGVAGPGGGDMMIGGDWAFNGSSGNTINSVNVGIGSYFYKVTGDAVGISGGLYVISSAIAPIPEPETYALMLAGLGAIGFVVARRRPLV